MSDIHHRVLGYIRLQEDQRSYEGQFSWEGETVPMYIECEKGQDHARCLDVVLKIRPRIERYLSAAKNYAASSMIQLKNDAWLDDGESLVTEEEFRNRMVLESVIVNGDGTASLTFLDGDIFWGHWIVVEFDENGTPTDAELAG